VARRRVLTTNIDVVPADNKRIEIGTFVYGNYAATPLDQDESRCVIPFLGEVKRFNTDERGRNKTIDIHITHVGHSESTVKNSLNPKIKDGKFKFDKTVRDLSLTSAQYERLDRCNEETKTVALTDLISLEPVIVAIRDIDHVGYMRSPRVVRRTGTELNMEID